MVELNEPSPAAALNPPPAVELRQLNFAYPAGRKVLADITAIWPSGSRVAIVGPSGAGKSTLLLHLNGLLPTVAAADVASCPVWIDNEPVIASRLRRVRQQVGFVFQDPDDQLFAATVAEDVAFGPRLLECDAAETQQRVTESLAAVGLPLVGHLNPGHLSYGERKRVCLAGVLACRPRILVLDEPSSNLDPRARRQLISMLRDLAVTVIIATHDLDLVLDLCDRVVLLDDGRIQAEGSPTYLLSDELLMDRHGLEVPWRLRPTKLP